MSEEQDKKDRPDPGPDPYDNDEYSRSHDENGDSLQERNRKQAEKYFRKGEKWVKKYD